MMRGGRGKVSLGRGVFSPLAKQEIGDTPKTGLLFLMTLTVSAQATPGVPDILDQLTKQQASDILLDMNENIDAQIKLADKMVDETRATLRETQHSLNAAWKIRESLITAKFDALTDEELMSDEAALKLFVRESNHMQHLHKRLLSMTAPKNQGLYFGNSDAREEFFGLPILTLTLDREQAVAEVAIVLQAWIEKWSMGRDTLPIDVLCYSEDMGTYEAMYNRHTNKIKVYRRYGGESAPPFVGFLEEGLAYVAKHAYFRDNSKNAHH